MSWMRCSACKSAIDFGAVHWVCSVSTCNRRGTEYKFCSVACWDSHVAMLNHRDAWAVEAVGPSLEEEQRQRQQVSTAPLRPASAAPTAAAPTAAGSAPAASALAPAPAPPLALGPAEREILIVVSKMKKYIRERSGMNTSDAVAEVLSDHVRALCDLAIQTAAGDGRKTVLDRDVPRVRR
jgi:hypothetical protein